MKNKSKPKPKPKPKPKKDVFSRSKSYVGVKKVSSTPMTRGEYNKYRGWEIPKNENPKDQGFIVKYENNYISWCPKKDFLESNRLCEGMTFGHAIEMAKKGHKIAREGWNGKGMWVIFVPGTKKAKLIEGTPYAKHLSKRKTVDILPHFDMYTVNSKGRRAMLPGWLASQSDMDAEDWTIV